MILRGVGKYIVVRPAGPEEEVTEAGLVIPASAEQGDHRVCEGAVVGVGDDVFDRLYPELTVYYKAGVGYEVEYEGETLLAVEEMDVIAVEWDPEWDEDEDEDEECEGEEHY